MLCAFSTFSLPFACQLGDDLLPFRKKNNIFASTESWHECNDKFYGNCVVWLFDGILSACAMRSNIRCKDEKMLVNADLELSGGELKRS